MHRPTRRLDFAIILRFGVAPQVAALERGADSARMQYPQTGAVLDGASWRRTPNARSPLTVESTPDAQRAAMEFVNAAWDIRRDAPVRQLLLASASDESATLV